MDKNGTLATPTPTSTPEGTAIGVVTVSGIQDVSGFLPLLGTEQCEEHISNALDRGYLYAAGTPMSMFGSLGIIKAGFAALWLSIDRSPLHGPRLLRNVGFTPKGVMRKLAYAMDTDDSTYVAEEHIRSILRRYSGIGVEINLTSWNWIRWNTLMSVSTIILSSLGLAPFIYIIEFDLERRPFSQGWMYPFLRVYGCVLATIMIQLVIQLRGLTIIHNRLRFHALNNWFQNNGRVPPFSWNPECRAEESLTNLAHDISFYQEPIVANDADPDEGNPKYCHGLENAAAATHSFSSFDADLAEKNYRDPWSKHINKYAAMGIPTFLLVICRVLLFGGIAAAGVGYVGCFSLIQASNSDNAIGPGVWLAAEVALCIIRLVIWASNPCFDDPPPPISIHKRGAESPTVTYDVGWTLDDVVIDNLHAVVVGINTTLDDDLPRLECAVSDAEAVVTYLEHILAVPKHQITLLKNANCEVIEQALERMTMDKDILPGSPIIIYLACQAREVGSEEFIRPTGQHRPALKFLTSEYSSKTSTTTGLLYTTLLRLIHELAASKGNNITVILDTCFAGSFGWNATHDNKPQFEEVSKSTCGGSTAKEKVTNGSRNTSCTGGTFRLSSVNMRSKVARHEYLIGYSSHVLLAACSASESAHESSYLNGGQEGGYFTQALLHRLRTPMKGGRGRKMTYRSLVDELRSDLKPWQTPLVSGNFQNRLVFGGLLATRQLRGYSSKGECVISISADEGETGSTGDHKPIF